MKTLILNNDEVKELLTIRESFIAVGEAYKAYSSGKDISAAHCIYRSSEP